jgi:hypothetical protein
MRLVLLVYHTFNRAVSNDPWSSHRVYLFCPHGADSQIRLDMANGRVFGDEARRQQRLRFHDVTMEQSGNQTLVLQPATGCVAGVSEEQTSLRIPAQGSPDDTVDRSPESTGIE